MKIKNLLRILMLFLFTFTFISCKTYKNSEVNSIGIIGSADGPTAIYIKVNPNFLIQKSLDIIQNLCLLAKDSTYINYSTNNTEIIKVIDNLSSCDLNSKYTLFKVEDLRPFISVFLGDSITNDNITERIYKSIPMRINSYSGSLKLAATSLLSCDDVFHYDKLKAPCLFIYSFDKFCCMVLFMPHNESIVQSYANFIINPMLINLQTEAQIKDFFSKVLDVQGLDIEIVK